MKIKGWSSELWKFCRDVAFRKSFNVRAKSPCPRLTERKSEIYLNKYVLPARVHILFAQTWYCQRSWNAHAESI